MFISVDSGMFYQLNYKFFQSQGSQGKKQQKKIPQALNLKACVVYFKTISHCYQRLSSYVKWSVHFINLKFLMLTLLLATEEYELIEADLIDNFTTSLVHADWNFEVKTFFHFVILL